MIRNNKVYDNINKIPYYNKNYAWDYSPIGSAVCKDHAACNPDSNDYSPSDCPVTCRYGKDIQDYIIDGQGVYVTRNSDTYLVGRMEMSGNEAYGNGINGLVYHRTHRGLVKNNVLYSNGAVPKWPRGAKTSADAAASEYPEDLEDPANAW